jgi:hypothetical protein
MDYVRLQDAARLRRMQYRPDLLEVPRQHPPVPRTLL